MSHLKNVELESGTETGGEEDILKYAEEDEKEKATAQRLRDRAFLKTLRSRAPTFHTCHAKSDHGQKSLNNRWICDPEGIIIHYPEVLCLTGPDFGSFREIPLSKEHLNFNYNLEWFDPTINLFATQDLVALEFRKSHFWTTHIYVYNRKSLELVNSKSEFWGHFYTGDIDGKKQLIFRDIDEETYETRVVKIDPQGQEELVWVGYAADDCLQDKKDRMVQVHVHQKKTVLRFCYWCSEGTLDDIETDIMTEEFKMDYPIMLAELKVEWFDSCNIVALEGRTTTYDRLEAVSLVNMSSGSVELDLKWHRGDFFVCYAVSKDFLVIGVRNFEKLRGPYGHITRLTVKNRDTGVVRELLVPEFADMVGGLKLIAGSILVAMPCGNAAFKRGRVFEHIYSMDLAEEDPGASVLSFRVPVSEVRPLGCDKIVCKIEGQLEDHFVIYSLV